MVIHDGVVCVCDFFIVKFWRLIRIRSFFSLTSRICSCGRNLGARMHVDMHVVWAARAPKARGTKFAKKRHVAFNQR